MGKYLLVWAMLWNSTAVFSQSDLLLDGPLMNFESSFHDFESVVQGELLEHTFKFINDGNRPLVISNVLTSCDCTASEWPKEPVQSGDGGIIKVTVNTTGKLDHQRKIITILSNSVNERIELVVETFVLPKRSQFE